MRKYAAILSALLLALFMLLPAKADNPPFKRAEIFNHEVSSNADICTASWVPPAAGTAGSRSGVLAYRMTIALKTTDSVVELQIVSGGVTVEADLNSGTALTAGKLYTFTFGASSTYTYNLHCETATTIGYLLIEEIRDGAL